MATQTEIESGIDRELIESNKEFAHFKQRTVSTKTIGGCIIRLTQDGSDGRASIKKVALDRAITKITAKGIRLPTYMNFRFSGAKGVRCVAYMSDVEVPDVYLGPKIAQLNPEQPHTGIVGGLGLKTVGVRGVSSQIYDSTGGSFLGIGDPKLKAQATAIVVHELGHVLHAQLSPSIFWDGKNGKYASNAWQLVSTSVSHYATQNGLEFVAETFTGTIMGRVYGQDVRDAYAGLGGPTSENFWNEN